jgi:hypothetical protein
MEIDNQHQTFGGSVALILMADSDVTLHFTIQRSILLSKEKKYLGKDIITHAK